MFGFPREPARPASRRTTGRVLLVVAATVYFVLGIGYLVLRWAVWPNLELLRPVMIGQMTEALGRPVTFQRVETDFDGLRPVIRLAGLSLSAVDGSEAAAAPQVRAVVSLRNLAIGRLRLTALEIDAPRVVVERRESGRWRVAGVDLGGPTGGDDHPALDAMLAQREIRVRGGSVRLVDRVAGNERTLTGIDLTVDNAGRRHRVSLAIADGGGLAGQLSATTEFYRAPLSRPSDASQWAGELYADVDRLAGEPLRAWLPLPEGLPQVGAADLRLWVRFDGGRFPDTLLKAALSDVRLPVGQAGGEPLALSRLRADVTAAPVDGGGTALTLRNVEAVAADGQFTVRGAGDQSLWLDVDGRPASGRLLLQPFELAPLAAALRGPLARHLPERWRELALRGAVQRFELSFARGQHLTWDAQADFDRVSVLLPTRAPGPAAGRPGLLPPSLENLSGSLRLGDDQGELSLTGQRAALTFPGLFDEPRIAFDELAARLRWQQATRANEPDLAVTVEQLRFANADAAGTITGQWKTGGKGPGFADLQGALTRFVPARVARYLPASLPTPVRGWVQRAITGGRGEGARFRLRGDLHEFPYRDPQSGEFRFEADVADGTLAFADGWPAIERIQARVAVDRVALTVDARSARMQGLGLADVQARIDDLSVGQLAIDGTAAGAAQDMVRYVNDSPLGRMIDHFTAGTVIDGPAQLRLKLGLPLADLAHPQVDGTLQLEGNRVALDPQLPVLSDVRGRLEFGDRGLTWRNLRANLFGGSVRSDGDTPEPGRFVVRVQGSTDADAIRALADNVLTRQLSGATDYRGTVDVRRGHTTLTVESELVGLASSLPEPLRKDAPARWPLKVVVSPSGGDEGQAPMRDQVTATLRDGIRLLVERRRAAAGEPLRVSRAALAVNVGSVLPERGFAVAIALPATDADAWARVLDEAASAGGPAPAAPGGGAAGAGTASEFADGFSLTPSQVSIVTDRLTLGGKDLHQVVFGASRLDDVWRANVSAREVNGFFNWHAPAPGHKVGTLNARFTRLEIPPSRRTEIESLLESSPQNLPNLDVTAEEFVLNDHRFGALKVVARNENAAGGSAWNLTELRVDNPSGVLTATGLWSPPRAGAPRSTQLDYVLDLRDAGGLLADFGLHDVIRGGAGKLDGRIAWNGSPLAIDYASLAGRTRLAIGQGQFLKTDPGIAKLIGVVNLQSLPRRLSLDFRDVFAEGFAFDQIQGDVTIDHGVARTDDLAMRGVQAQVEIRGAADIARETQSLDVRVRPDLNAGLASLAYAAAVNPVIGLGSFVAQLVLRKPLEELFTYEYGITGSWTDPVVVEKRRFVDPAESRQRSPNY